MSGNVWQPTTVDEIREVLQRPNTPIVLRGSGNSSVYVPPNGAGMTIDLSRMKNLKWDLEKRVVYVEPGVTVYELCCQALAQGFWPCVVPMTVQVTLGGSLSVNAYGANPYKQGPIGMYIDSFELLLASGELLNVSVLQDELFYSVIGGLGLLGVVTNIAIQLHPINLNTLLIRQVVVPSLLEMINTFDRQALSADYLVGWIDSYATGNYTGRGVVISGNYAHMRELDDVKVSSRASDDSDMSSKQWLLHSLMYNGGVKVANSIYYNLSMRSREEPSRRMPLGEFHLRLYPWYHPLHIMRHMRGHFFQPFVPAAEAPKIFPWLLECSRRAGFIPFRCILRRHKADSFWLSYQIDGFSLELTYSVKPEKNAEWMELMEELHEQVIKVGGRFYHARDITLNRLSYARSIGEDTIQRFNELKNRYDPDERFLSHLYQRLLI